MLTVKPEYMDMFGPSAWVVRLVVGIAVITGHEDETTKVEDRIRGLAGPTYYVILTVTLT